MTETALMIFYFEQVADDILTEADLMHHQDLFHAALHNILSEGAVLVHASAPNPDVSPFKPSSTPPLTLTLPLPKISSCKNLMENKNDNSDLGKAQPQLND